MPVTVARVDLGALARNYHALATFLQAAAAASGRPAPAIVAVVKADGYGHGLVPVARTLAAAA